ncbi:MAG: patatin-like phospholipase family protein [Cyanobium sp.]
MAKKLAIVISGAVSLGSYEAGVMYEVLEAIARHNEREQDEHQQIKIDKITGASAGGMTAAILAQNLLYDDGSLRSPYDNKLYKAWVEMIDIIPLLQNKKGDQKRSLLDIHIIESIANQLLVSEETLKEQNGSGSLGQHPAAANRLRVGIAMANMNGYKYEIPTTGDPPFGYTRFKDQLMCEVERKPDSTSSLQELALVPDAATGSLHWQAAGDMTWGMLREAGISSGAFPLAFPLRKITRSGFGLSQPDNRFVNRDGNFLYTDGGVFENEPVGLAHALLESPQDSNRFYLLIKPGPKAASVGSITSEREDLLQTLFALVGAVVQQAQFQDFVMERLGREAGIADRLLTITSKDSTLVGDILSAFSGFLEQKFRAYDYNIGRETARNQLKRAFEKQLINFDPEAPGAMPEIGWVVGRNDTDLNMADEERLNWSLTLNRNLNSWNDAKSLMRTIADSPDSQHDELKDLHLLMREVRPSTRKEIAKQLMDRLNNLIDYINDTYLQRADENIKHEIDEAATQWWQDHFSNHIPTSVLQLLPANLFKGVRESVGKPMLKLIASALLKGWLKANIIDPPAA